MRTEITINGSSELASNYIAWAPVPCQVRLVDATEADGPVAVRLSNQNPSQGGQIVFYPAVPGPAQDDIQLTLPVDGSPVPLFIAGKFGKPSTTDKDAIIETRDAGNGNLLSMSSLMVRVRKNANDLTGAERDRFLSAIARLNDRGMGRFSDFRNIHTDAGSPEAHFNAGFLPWHRAFMLDLERELQALDPSVTLPYWKFDEVARNLFSRSFMGVPNAIGTLRFSANNPLQFWVTDMSPGIVRQPFFNTTTQSAFVDGEADTLNLGDAYARFANMEGNPHGFAHTSFGGFISDIPTAAKDPLFFMLHANVDRLWAKWQWLNRRFDIGSIDTYAFPGAAGSPGSTRIGHNLNDTMWPWNQITGFPRPPSAPGGNFPDSAIVSTPGPIPAVRDMIDYQGVLNPASRLGFDYDDVPFEF